MAKTTRVIALALLCAFFLTFYTSARAGGAVNYIPNRLQTQVCMVNHCSDYLDDKGAAIASLMPYLHQAFPNYNAQYCGLAVSFVIHETTFEVNWSYTTGPAGTEPCGDVPAPQLYGYQTYHQTVNV